MQFQDYPQPDNDDREQANRDPEEHSPHMPHRSPYPPARLPPRFVISAPRRKLHLRHEATAFDSSRGVPPSTRARR